MTDIRPVRIKTASLGVKDIVFFVVAAAAPLGATVGATPVVFATGGSNTPILYLFAALILWLFAVGLATMNRHVITSGGFTDIVGTGFGKMAGHVAAGIALLAYISMLTGLYGQFAALTSETIKEFTSVDIPWQVCLLTALVSIGYCGYRDIDFSAKVLGILMILEIAILLVFDIVVMIRNGIESLTVTGVLDSNITGADTAVALMFALACFVGFESTTIYSEEAKNPHKTIPRATYIAVFIIGFFFVLTSLCLRSAYGSDEVRNLAQTNMISFVFSANTQYVGAFSTSIMRILVITSVFAVLLSFHNALCRYILSLSRKNYLPKTLSSVHKKFHSPYISSLVLSLTLFLLLTGFMFLRADPVSELYMWMVGTGTLAIIILQALGAFAISTYFYKSRHNEILKGVASPLIGGAALLCISVFAILNFNLLSGTDKGVSTYLPWLVLLAAAAGAINGFISEKRARLILMTDPE